MAYGAVDEAAQGSWKVWNKQVVLRSDAPPARQGALRRGYRLDFAPPEAVSGEFDFTLDVRAGALIWNRQGRELLSEKK
ncbi:hypothetical protein SAMN05428959_102267 [Duganella sp. CF517]|uniref:hypothetical protein n=1 Tax=Duganella sp. CF517 TaxID=1881038 RepID=UPI0008CA494D|nr:hypothetical protein [Duganella sp. CF517]SEN52981.1 hypothetical protein SAMN05428959_102267 [Duganella sp. CF517]